MAKQTGPRGPGINCRPDKREASSEEAIAVAKANGPSQVIIHKAGNKGIQEERTYGGKDPYPPKG